jgi:DNA-binding response OmpR family regulator
MSDLLLVEDDVKIGRLLTSALDASGHAAAWAADGATATRLARERRFDLVLLDLGLPDVDGIELCRELRRQQRDAVIVILTARRDEMDVVVGLESGADDYLTKPFRLTELLARIRAHLRRGSDSSATQSEPIQYGDLWLSVTSRQARVLDVELPLRMKEFDLLARLASEPGTAVSREALMADVWDENWFGSTKTLDVHIAALRRRLAGAAEVAGDGAAVPTVVTLRGFGYRLDLPSHDN